jgi:hypothetical protein
MPPRTIRHCECRSDQENYRGIVNASVALTTRAINQVRFSANVPCTTLVRTGPGSSRPLTDPQIPPNAHNFPRFPRAEPLRPPTTSQWKPTSQRRPMAGSICYAWPWRMLRVDSVRPRGSGRAAKVFRDALRANIRDATSNTPGRNICRDTL